MHWRPIVTPRDRCRLSRHEGLTEGAVLKPQESDAYNGPDLHYCFNALVRINVDDGCQSMHNIANPCRRCERYGCTYSSSEDKRSSTLANSRVVCYGANNGLDNSPAYWSNCQIREDCDLELPRD